MHFFGGWRLHKKVLDRNIEERPSDVDKREEFGHWETDLVIGSKSDFRYNLSGLLL